MSAVLPDRLPDSVDAWRMVAAKRSFEGEFSLRNMKRLAGLLAPSDEGDANAGSCRFVLAFGRESLGNSSYPQLSMKVEAVLPLVCQRTLATFLLPLTIEQHLGLIRHESEEAGLPSEVEPLLVPEDAQLRLMELVEDELILAVPVVPMSPGGAEDIETEWPAEGSESADERPNPFAELAKLKQRQN